MKSLERNMDWVARHKPTRNGTKTSIFILHVLICLGSLWSYKALWPDSSFHAPVQDPRPGWTLFVASSPVVAQSRSWRTFRPATLPMKPMATNGESANPRIVSDWAKKKCTDFEIPEIHRLSRVINRCNRNNMNELKKWQITTCVGPLLHPTTPLSCCLRNAKGETSTVLLKAVPDQNLWRRPKMSRICHSLQAHL